MDNKTGILLLSHGSKLIDGAQVINAYKDMYIKKYPEAIVEVGYMEIRQPDIPAAFENLKVRADLDKVIVVPVFIANGVHTKRDIPKILGLDARIMRKKLVVIMTIIMNIIMVMGIIITMKLSLLILMERLFLLNL